LINKNIEKIKEELYEMDCINQEYTGSGLPFVLLKMMLDIFNSIREVYVEFVEKESLILKNWKMINESLQEIETIFKTITNKSVRKLFYDEIRKKSPPKEILKVLIRESKIKCN